MSAIRNGSETGYPVHKGSPTVVIFPCFQRDLLDCADACAKAWHDLGFRVRLLLAFDGADSVAASGSGDIERVVMPADNDHAPGLSLRQVIADAEAAHPGCSLLLGNLPVMPLVRNRKLVDFWARLGGVLLMSVEFAADFELHDGGAPEPFLDGCDVLYLRHDHVAGVREFLDSLDRGDALRLGSRGWDIVLGEGFVAAEELPAAIGPAGVLVAGPPSDFLLSDCTPELLEAGLIDKVEDASEGDEANDLTPATQAADARIRFSVRLQRRANQHWGMRACFLNLPRPRLANSFREEAERVHTRIASSLMPADPDFLPARIARWLEAERVAGDSVLGSLAYFARSPSWHYRFTQALAAMCLMVESHGAPEIGQAKRANHAASHRLRRLLQDTSMPDYLQRYLVLELFAVLLFDAGQLSLELHDYLALSCENDIERDLLCALMKGVSKDHAHVA